MKKKMYTKAALVIVTGMLAASNIWPSAAHVKAAPSAAFKDTIPAWAEDSVKTVVDAGIMNGYPDGTFKPNDPITRAELLKVMALTFYLTVAPPSAGQLWYKPYEAALTNAKIYMSGDWPTDLTKPATRNEMAITAVRGSQAAYRGQRLTAAEFMFRAVNAGLLSRNGTSAEAIDTAGTTTRAQVAVLVTRLLKLQDGETLPVDQGASTAAEVAWHHHNMITMFGQDDLVSLPYKVNVNSKFDVSIEQMLVLDPGDSQGYYSQYLKDTEDFFLGGQYAQPNAGYLFAFKLKGISKVASNEYVDVLGVFYMFVESLQQGTFYPSDKYMFNDGKVIDRGGLYRNSTNFKLSKVGAEGYDYYYVFVDKNFIQSQIKKYGALPIHMERFAKQMDKNTQFYLTGVKDREWQQ
ncbi:S-layer homology domain-containing protein [Paenibacillus protaetiae]|nr:S-layer homology domain-containing protein [Paenibacillus protaetiae]